MVDIIPKKTEREMPFQNIALFVAGALLLSAILGYVILIRAEAVALSAQQDLEAAIAKVGTKDDRETETKVRNYEKAIKDLASLTGGSAKPSQFFNNFENLVHPKVWFSSFELDAALRQAAIKGNTVDFQTLEQQLVFLQSKTDLIEALELSDIGLREDGGVEFSLNLTLAPKIFNTIEE
ncbi:MAG: hypothetical protein HYW69_01065 [Candidatus Nealsonbacteria bacterium]|nr:hypothetical protein [Candidatus Nealsonbacteria bacterium]